MKVIAGLGNPTKEYVGTRHNIGFDGVTAIADKYRISVTEKAHKALVGKGVIGGERVLLMKPQTYMNLSGEAIADAMHFYKLEPEDLIVIYDDINLEPGAIRVREGGSAGGHNGMKDIIRHMGTDKFPRIRVGVGEKPAEWDLKDYVLGHFSKDDEPKIREALGNVVSAAELMLAGDMQKAMNSAIFVREVITIVLLFYHNLRMENSTGLSSEDFVVYAVHFGKGAFTEKMLNLVCVMNNCAFLKHCHAAIIIYKHKVVKRLEVITIFYFEMQGKDTSSGRATHRRD